MILETKRLYLRRFTMDDARRLSEYRDKKEVAEFQSWKRYHLFDAKRRIYYCLKNPHFSINKSNQFAVVLKSNHYIIGDIFVEINGEHSFILGYTLDSVYWNQGYGSEIVEGFLKYMKELGYKKVLAYVYKDNYRSIHLLEKLGFKSFNESIFYSDIGFIKKL